MFSDWLFQFDQDICQSGDIPVTNVYENLPNVADELAPLEQVQTNQTLTVRFISMENLRQMSTI